MPSTYAVSSKVCNQLKIIMFLSYLDKGFPLSLSTSLMVNGRFLPALCLATLSIAAFVLFEVVGLLLGVGLEPKIMFNYFNLNLFKTIKFIVTLFTYLELLSVKEQENYPYRNQIQGWLSL